MLSPAQKEMLGQHESKLNDIGVAEHERQAYVANIINSPEYQKPVCKHLPVLLRKTCMWSWKVKRLALPAEHMEMQGHLLFDAEDDPFKCSFSKGLENLSDGQVRALAGNGMHIRAIGACLLFALIGLKRQQQQPAAVVG